MTEMETSLPPPFIVGKIYEDEISTYKVLSVDRSRMTFERPDGTKVQTDNIPLKAAIYKRRLTERQHPTSINYQQLKVCTGTAEYSYEVVTPLVASVIEKHSAHSSEFLPHSRLKKGLLDDPLARSIIEKLPRTGTFQTAEAWGGVIIAGFSKEWTEGRWPLFERKKIGQGHAWRVKRRSSEL